LFLKGTPPVSPLKIIPNTNNIFLNLNKFPKLDKIEAIDYNQPHKASLR